jgi:tight adherence protein B
MEPLNLLVPLVTMVAVVAVVWGGYSLVTANRTEMAQRLGKYGGAARAVSFQPSRVALPLKDRSMSGFGFLDRLLTGNNYAERVADDLARAAVPMRVGEYLLLRWTVACLVFLAVRAISGNWVLGVLVGAMGYFVPRLWVSRREASRIRQIEDQLVDALTMIANGLRSGSSFLQAIEMVSRELPAPIAPEFGQVVAEAGVGAPVDQALEALAKRVRSYDIYLMVTAMTIQRSVGGNLSEVLENIAHTIRERQRLLRQVQVETAENRLSSYVLMVLPTALLIVISIINPRYVEPLLFEASGRVILIIGAVMQITGYIILRRIADVKV